MGVYEWRCLDEPDENVCVRAMQCNAMWDKPMHHPGTAAANLVVKLAACGGKSKSTRAPLFFSSALPPCGLLFRFTHLGRITALLFSFPIDRPNKTLGAGALTWLA